MPRRSSPFDIPAVARRPWGWSGFLLNLLPLGGIGSIVVGAKHGHRNLVYVGIAQAILTLAIVGWIWSVAWGFGILLRSR